MYLSRSRPRTALRHVLLAAFLALIPATLSGEPLESPAIRAWLETWSTGAEDDLDSFLTEDTVLQEPALSSDDLAGYRNLLRIGLSPLRDVEFTADDLMQDGDRAALVWSAAAIHNHSGRPVRIRGVSILHFRDGKIAREWRVYDRLDFLRQIGVVPGDGDGGGSGSD